VRSRGVEIAAEEFDDALKAGSENARRGFVVYMATLE
jgi:hypothetical protein